MSDKPKIRVRALRNDSYAEVFTGYTPRGNPASGLMQTGMDRSLSGPAGGSLFPSMQDLVSLYLTNGLAARVVDLVVDDSFSRGFVYKNDTANGYMASEYERLNVKQIFATATRWAQLYGAGAVVMFTDDADNLALPLNLDTMSKVVKLRPVDLLSIHPYGTAIEVDPESPWFGYFTHYQIQTQFTGVTFVCHCSRILPFSGPDLPAYLIRGFGTVPWLGRSILAGAYEEIQRYENMSRWTERMFERKQQFIYMMEGLGRYLEETRDPDTGLSLGQAAIRERLQMLDTVRSILNTVLIDNGEVNETGQTIGKGDKIETHDLNLSNVPQALGTIQMNVASKTGYSVTVLFGRSSSGLNASGDREMESHYNHCASVQSRAAPALKMLTSVILRQASANRKFNAKKDAVKVDFAPLQLPSDLEAAQAAQANGQANLNNANAVAALMASTLTPEAALTWMAEQGMFGITTEAIPAIVANIQKLKQENTQTPQNRPDNKVLQS